MSIKINWSELWRRWFGFSGDRFCAVLDILRHRYVDEKQHADRFSEHALKMHYPQFREALFRIASDESKHADLVAAKIKEMGGWLPAVIEAPGKIEQNSWHYLLEDLEEERRCGAELEEDRLIAESGYPEVAELLERIDEEERKHRVEIRGMLMRSDSQALWSA